MDMTNYLRTLNLSGKSSLYKDIASTGGIFASRNQNWVTTVDCSWRAVDEPRIQNTLSASIRDQHWR